MNNPASTLVRSTRLRIGLLVVLSGFLILSVLLMRSSDSSADPVALTEAVAQPDSINGTFPVIEAGEAMVEGAVATEEVDTEEELDPIVPDSLAEQVFAEQSNDHPETVQVVEQVTSTLPDSPPEPAIVVEMTTLTFSPLSVTIRAGEAVEWRNTSLLVHTVTGDPSKATIEGSASLPSGGQAFDSGELNPQAIFRHTFRIPGTYRYFCIPHEGVRMRGTVVVQ